MNCGCVQSGMRIGEQNEKEQEEEKNRSSREERRKRRWQGGRIDGKNRERGALAMWFVEHVEQST